LRQEATDELQTHGVNNFPTDFQMSPTQGQGFVFFQFQFKTRNNKIMNQKKDIHLVGRTIKLIKMTDPHPVEPNTKGVIYRVDDINNYHVRWENGRTLVVVPGEDKFELVD
jgi:hypothetical protein